MIDLNMIVIVDIDGSIADWKARRNYVGKSPGRTNQQAYEDYIYRLTDESKIAQDTPILGMQSILRALSTKEELEIVYLTGRSEKLRKVTQRWLLLHRFPEAKLLMRNNDDWRNAVEYKKAVVNDLLSGKIAVAIEDEPEVVQMMVEHGITVLQVHYKG